MSKGSFRGHFFVHLQHLNKLMMKRLIFTLILSLLTIATVSAHDQCASDLIEQSMMTMYPKYTRDRSQLETFTQQFGATNANNARMLSFGCQRTAAVYEIAIVVNVMYTNTTNNISDAQINQGIADMNSFWVPQMGIKFVLAKTDPDGNPTTGINRVNCSSIPNYESIGIDPSTSPTGAPDTTVKNKKRWDRHKYINFWIVAKSAISAAYANMPSDYEFEGIVIPYNAFGTPQNKTAAAHEMGHFFNLYHTFQGSSGSTCALNSSPSTQGDKCADTPPVLVTDDGSTSSCGTYANIFNSTHNLMSYCVITDLFTADQKTRVLAALFSEFRWSLVSSPGLTPADAPFEVSMDSIAFEQDLSQAICNGFLDSKIQLTNFRNRVDSIEFMATVDGQDSIFTIRNLGLQRGSNNWLSIFTSYFPISGSHTIEITIRKVNGVADYNVFNNNLCTTINVIVQTVTITTQMNNVNAGSITGTKTFSCNNVNDTIRVTTNPGFTFQSIKKGNVIVSTNPTYIVSVDLSQGNQTFTAYHTVQTFNVSASTAPSNGGTVTGTGTYNYGSNVTVTFKSKAGYQLVNVTENGNSISTDSVISISSLTQNRSFVGNFVLKTFIVNVSANGGGSVSGGGTVSYGSNTTVNATEFSCYQFTNWTENGNIVSSNKNYTFTVTGPRNLVANFTQRQFLIVAAVNNSSFGTTTGGDTYNCGSNATVKAHVKTGGKFVNWTENSIAVSSDSVYTFQATGTRNLVANFTAATYMISASTNITGAGTISGSGLLSYGTTATLLATVNSCYVFDGWKENGNFVSTSLSYPFTVTTARNLVAVYHKKQYTVSTSVNDINKGTVTSSNSYDCGTQVTLIATPNASGKWKHWTDRNGNVISTDSVLQISASQDTAVIAYFTAADIATGIINHNSDIDFKIFPNPTSSYLTVELGNLETYHAKIYNLIGDLLWSADITKQFTVDVTSFAKGTYILKIDDGISSFISTKRFIVN